MTMGQRARQRREQLKLSLPELARRIGQNVSWQSIQQFEKNQVRQPRYLYSLARELGVSLEWLEEKPGAPEPKDSVPTPAPDDGFPFAPMAAPSDALLPDTLPILGSARGGADGAFEMNGQVHEWIARPPHLKTVRDAYAVYVRGDSMSPRYEPGWIVHVHPGRPPEPGDNVVVQIRNPDPHEPPLAYVKTLVSHTLGAEGELIVRQFNPAKELRWADGEVVSVHKIVGTVET